MKSILVLTLLVTGLLPTQPVLAEGPISVVHGFDAELGQPVETAQGPDGRLAWVVAGKDGHRLFVDGVLVETAVAIEHLAWTRGGELVYWLRSSRGSRMIWGERRGRAWDDIRTPDLAVVARAHEPSRWSWSDRGGASMAFAARDQRDPDRWVLLSRRPSQPEDIDRRPLATTRVVRDDVDPLISRTMALRYHLVAGRVPAYIGRSGTEECLVVGTREMACGVRIEMIASAPGTGRLLVAWREREGEDLYLSDGLETTGPWRRIDWVSFTGDGLRYAVMVSDQGGDRIQTNQGTTGGPGRLAALAHLSTGELASLWFSEKQAMLLAGERVLVASEQITRFLRPPNGDPAPIIRDRKGFRLGVDADAPRFRQIWGEGFLVDGRVSAQVTPLDGGQGLVIGDAVQAKGDALTWFVASKDGSRVLAVFHDHATGGESVFLDGEVVFGTDEVTGLGFVGVGAAARPWVRGYRGAEECLWTHLSGNGLCCEAPLGWTGAPAAPTLLCHGKDGPSTVSEPGEKEPVDAIPSEFLGVGKDGRIVWYVTRAETGWRLHGADGRAVALPGTPRLLLAGPEDGDHPRILLQTVDGQGWFCGRGGDRFSAEIAQMPHEIRELGPVYAARRDGQVHWVAPTFVTPGVDGLGSAPHSTVEGLSWWQRHGGRWQWVMYRYDVME